MTTTAPLWTFDALLAASGGALDGVAPSAIAGISIDTRSLERGDLFVPLKDARDGHDFVSAAFAKGAAASLVRHDYQRHPSDNTLIRVDDPLRALERIAAAARARLSPSAKVIAVTGSAGKTGTKEMLRACLAPLGRTHAPEKSFNNHWGVPLTLARMPADTVFAVVEIGMNHAGEITPLTKLTRPHIAIVTNVLPVHVGNFPDGEIGVANAKAEIFSGLVSGGHAVILRDNPHFERLAAAASGAGARVVGFGRHPQADWRAAEIATTPEGPTIVSLLDGQCYEIAMAGEHLALNSLAVAFTVPFASQSTRPLSELMAPLARVRAPAGRGARETVHLPTGGTLLLIDESYNANPASMRAALATLAAVPRDKHPRRIAALGDMRELGVDAPMHHRNLADAVDASGADLVFACGEHMQHLFERVQAARRGSWAPTSTDLVPALKSALADGDVVMIKGSLGTNMAPLVAAVRALGKSKPAG
jgi:UDP-N-acetylmuramoyl-tripeptide--D-alanyl-D-alanine ligase